MSNSTESPKLTFGQELVGIRFNPSGMSEVDMIKLQFANMIDDINDTVVEGYLKQTIKGQSIRVLADACMWAVKFHVTK